MRQTIKQEKQMDSEIKLSVLVPTVVGREHLFDILLAELKNQSFEKPVEIVVCKDNKELSIGSKRQKLIEQAQGEYIVFVDDDDMVALDYIDQILSNTGSDAIGFQIECTFDGKNKCLASASRRYKDWGENRDGFRYVRSIYHKTPVRRELALKAGFKDMRFGEDYDYSMRIMPLIKSEAYINKVMYYYRYIGESHNEKYGIK